MPVTKFYYRASVIWYWLGLIGIVFLNLLDLPSTYFVLLTDYPGRLIINVVLAVLVIYLLWQLPAVVRTVLRIPVIEYDGQVLLVRGWNNQSFSVAQERGISFRVDEQHQWIHLCAGSKSARIHMRQIDGPTSVIRFLEGLTSEPGEQSLAV